MIPKAKTVQHLNNIKAVVWVPGLEIGQDLNFFPSLFVEPRLVLDNLDGELLFVFVVKDFYHLSKAPTSQSGDDLVPVSQMVSYDYFVFSFFVVKAVVFYSTFGFAYSDSDEIDFRVTGNFRLFVMGQV